MKEFLHHYITMPMNHKFGFLIQLQQQEQCSQRIGTMQMYNIWLIIVQHSTKHHTHLERNRLATHLAPHTYSVNSYSVYHLIYIFWAVIEAENHLLVFRHTLSHILADIL